MIEAVTFDFWDTLVHAPKAVASRAARQERLGGVLIEAGADVSDERLAAVLSDIRREFDERWARNEQYTVIDATDRLIADLGVVVDEDVRALIGRRFMGFDDPWVPDLTPNIRVTLQSLKGRGIAIGIICDVGLSPSPVLRSYLDRHGVLDLFDHWSFSDEVGVYKPDPAIFDHARTGLGGIASRCCAHVGDLRRTDVAGAIGAGWTAVRYAGSNDDVDEVGEGDRSMVVSDADAPEAPIVIRDHADLATALGLA